MCIPDDERLPQGELLYFYLVHIGRERQDTLVEQPADETGEVDG